MPHLVGKDGRPPLFLTPLSLYLFVIASSRVISVCDLPVSLRPS